MSIWNQIRQLFKEVEQSSPNEPVVHEIIKRSLAQQTYQEKFTRGLIHIQLKKWISDQYAAFQSGNQIRTDHLQFINDVSLKGFVIYFSETQFNKQEMIAFFDCLKETVLKNGYYNYVSDRRTYNKNGKKEATERHYLKPSQKGKNVHQLSQQFGNINIELIFRNNEIQMLKFSATSYKDQLYDLANPFSELIKIITEN